MCAASYPSWERFLKTSRARRYKWPLVAPETPSFMGAPPVTRPDEIKGADFAILGAPYVATYGDQYAGVHMNEWIAAPKRVRQQSVRYPGGYIQDFDIEVFDHVNVVDYGDVDIPLSLMQDQTAEGILDAQAMVEEKVSHILDAGAIPIVIGQNSPCGTYAVAKPICEHTMGEVGCISLDTHWDSLTFDELTNDPRIAGSGCWKYRMYQFQPTMHPRSLVEIGERGPMEERETVHHYIDDGARFISSWDVRSGVGIEGVVDALDQAYRGTNGVYVHFDMDVLGGAGPAPGDILGELAEPIGLTDYETIRIAHEIGKRGLSGMSLVAIPPGSQVIYRVIVYVIMYLMAGMAMRTD